MYMIVLKKQEHQHIYGTNYSDAPLHTWCCILCHFHLHNATGSIQPQCMLGILELLCKLDFKDFTRSQTQKSWLKK
jgi:hypothetical protein